MNIKKSTSYFKIRDNKDSLENEDEDDDYINLNLSKKNIEKFKPKKNLINKNSPSLRGAENKIKSILSSFLLTMESDDDKKYKRIKYLKEKLSTKKLRFNYDVHNGKKNIRNLKTVNSLFLNSAEHNKETNNEKSEILLVNYKKRIYNEDNIINKKTPIKLKLFKKYESKTKSDINKSSFRSKSNYKSDVYNRSTINKEENEKYK